MSTIQASVAMMKVLDEWGVENIYGLPGGSFDSTMNAIHEYREKIRYIGVRHEEVGALAAVAEAKLTGKIAVTFGSAGPGAAHLLNALYDAKTDRVPVLALIGQVPTSRMNTDFFQEMPENPMFEDVSVYNRTVMTAEQLPYVVDHAIRTAYEERGVAVVVIPKDLGWQQIEDTFISSAASHAEPTWWERPAREEDVAKALDIIAEAKRPIIYFGRGAEGAEKELLALSQALDAPLVSTYLAKGIVPDNHPSYMISTGRVATKPGVDTARAADVVLFVGTNYEFPMFAPDARFIDVNLRPSIIGNHHAPVLGIRADAMAFLRQLLAETERRGTDLEPRKNDRKAWLTAAQEDRQQWADWIASKEIDDRTPVRFEPIYALLNEYMAKDAVVGVDVGNVNISVARFLNLHGGRRQVSSPLYATMGFGLPAGIAAALRYPDKEIWTLSGDGAMAMVVPDLVTMASNNLPVINVVFTNKSLGFIKAEQDDTHQPYSGVLIDDVDFAKVAEGFGVKGYTVTSREELRRVLAEVKGTTVPVLIDVKLTDDRQLPVEQFPLAATDPSALDAFRAEFEAEPLEPFAQILERHGVSLGSN